MDKTEIEKQRQKKLVGEIFLAIIQTEERCYNQYKKLIEPLLDRAILGDSIDGFDLIQLKEFYDERSKVSGFLEDNRYEVFEYLDSLEVEND